MSPLCHLVPKFSAASFARIRQHSRVNTAVDQVGDSLSEALTAGLTHEGSLSAVDPLVVLES